MSIEKLPSFFVGSGSVKGFIFKRVYDSYTLYAYEVDTGSGKHYEVFRKKTVAKCIDFENKIYSDTEFKEVYPKDKDFGDWAFTVMNHDDITKFDVLHP